MKKTLKIIGLTFLGIIAFVGIILAAVFYLTKDLPQVGNQFVTEILEQDFASAHQLTSVMFQQQYSIEDLKEVFDQSNVTEEMVFESASWHSRSVSNGQGSISGTVTLTNGGVIPANISFVKEKDQWKIISFQF